MEASSGGRPKSIRRIAMGKDQVPWQEKEGKLGSLGKAAVPHWLYAGATHSVKRVRLRGKERKHTTECRPTGGSWAAQTFSGQCLRKLQGSRSLAPGGKCLTTRPGTSVLTDFLSTGQGAEAPRLCRPWQTLLIRGTKQHPSGNMKSWTVHT